MEQSSLLVLGAVVLGAIAPLLVQLAKRLALYKYADWGLEVEGNFAHALFILLSGLLAGGWLFLTDQLAPFPQGATPLQILEHAATLLLSIYGVGTSIYFKALKQYLPED